MGEPRNGGAESAIAAYYDRLAGVYGAGVYFGARRRAVLDGIAGELAEAAMVLDLGCGNGAFLRDLSASDRRVVGMDLSPAMLHAARERVGGAGGLVRGDALGLPFRAGMFDLVFMSHVLLLIADIDGFLAGVAGVLHRGGRLIATVGASGWPAALQRLIGAPAAEDLRAIVGSVRPPAQRHEAGAVDAACRHHGLVPARRTVEFFVSWPELAEWLRLRWLSLADEELRGRGDAWLSALGSRLGDRMLGMSETLLVAVRE